MFPMKTTAATGAIPSAGSDAIRGATPSGAPGPGAVPTREGYDRWSEVYDADANPLIMLEEPIMRELIGDVRGASVLDVGCGTGRWSTRLAAAGARITGIDFSAGMLNQALAKGPGDAVHFVLNDFHRPFPLRDGAFNCVVCALVLDHIHDLAHFFGEMRRVCHRDGHIVISSMHPAMMLRGVSARFTDPATGQKVHLASAANQISDYVMAAIGAGLKIVHMSEHAMDETTAGTHERARAYLGWPMLLTMRLRP